MCRPHRLEAATGTQRRGIDRTALKLQSCSDVGSHIEAVQFSKQFNVAAVQLRGFQIEAIQFPMQFNVAADVVKHLSRLRLSDERTPKQHKRFLL